MLQHVHGQHQVRLAGEIVDAGERPILEPAEIRRRLVVEVGADHPRVGPERVGEAAGEEPAAAGEVDHQPRRAAAIVPVTRRDRVPVLRAAIALVLGLLPLGWAHADEWPAKPVRVVVAFGAGGEGSFRICYAAERSILEPAMERLTKFLQSHD